MNFKKKLNEIKKLREANILLSASVEASSEAFDMSLNISQS